MVGSDKPELDEVTTQTPIPTASPPPPAAPPPNASPGDAASTAPPTMHDEADASYLDTAVQGQIGRQLRSMYDSLVEQPVPDRFVRLLEELERKGHSPG